MDAWETLLYQSNVERKKARAKIKKDQAKMARGKKAQAKMMANYGLCVNQENVVFVDYKLLAQYDVQRVPTSVMRKLCLTESQFATVSMLNKLPREQKEGLAAQPPMKLYKTPKDLAEAFLNQNLVTC
jgi:hypothetical protein